MGAVLLLVPPLLSDAARARLQARGERRKAKGAASAGRRARPPGDRFSLGQGILP